MKMIIQPQGRLRHFSVERNPMQPRCGWGPKPFPTQGSRSGNPGLKAVTALRFCMLITPGGPTMRVRIARKIIKGLVTPLILNASLATNVPVSATSSTLLSKQQQSETAPARRESVREVDDLPLSPCLLALSDRLKASDRKALDSL